MEVCMSTAAVSTQAPVSNVTKRPPLAVLGKVTAWSFVILALQWVWFQIFSIEALFPPIGPLYALGCLVVAGVIAKRHRWAPALGAGWSVVMLAIESVPAIDHLLHWDEVYSHLAHYLLLTVFVPMAVFIVITGVSATRQNYSVAAAERDTPAWLIPLAVVTTVVIVIGFGAIVSVDQFELV
jgi:hypothetical protein